MTDKSNRGAVFAVLGIAAFCAFAARGSQYPPLVPGYAPDVPPKEWDGPEKVWQGCGTSTGACGNDAIMLQHHRTCADTSRFLMMSEDGKWHCLKFWPDKVQR